MSRDRAYALAASVFVIVVLILGFQEIGPPARQRVANADVKRISDLRSIAAAITQQGSLPLNLDENGSWRDPELKAPYECMRDTLNTYHLCAVFQAAKADNSDLLWSHGPGRQCFSLTIR